MEAHRLVGLREERYVTLALFTRVRNAGKLRSLATSGALQASLLEPTLVCEMKHRLTCDCLVVLSQFFHSNELITVWPLYFYPYCVAPALTFWGQLHLSIYLYLVPDF